jgi:hypothetical protein
MLCASRGGASARTRCGQPSISGSARDERPGRGNGERAHDLVGFLEELVAWQAWLARTGGRGAGQQGGEERRQVGHAGEKKSSGEQ